MSRWKRFRGHWMVSSEGNDDEVMIENQRQKLKIMVPIDKVKSLMKEQIRYN